MTMKKKIAIFINSLQYGGAERALSNLTNHLLEKYDIYLILLNADIIKYPLSPDIHIKQLGKKAENESRQLLNILKIPINAKRLKRYLEENGITLILSFLNRPNFTACYLKRLNWGGRIVISERTYTDSYYSKKSLKGRLGRFLIKKLYNYSDLVIANSELSGVDFKKIFKIKKSVIVINNPVNVADIAAASSIPRNELPGNDAGSFTFCSIGRLDYLKNFELLINAMALLRNMHCRLLIIGQGELLNQLKARVEELGLSEKVFFTGHKENPYEYLKSADAFVLSSNLEGFPNVILEALACSLPVISTDCKSGPREILAPLTSYADQKISDYELAEYGILVPVNNPILLSDAMLRIIKDDELRANYKQKAGIRAKNYDIALISSKFIKMLEATQ